MAVVFTMLSVWLASHLDGKISFLKALKVGALICFVASTIYVIFGLSYYYLFAPDFICVYIEYVIKNAPADKVETLTAQMANFKKMYRITIFNFNYLHRSIANWHDRSIVQCSYCKEKEISQFGFHNPLVLIG